MLASPAIDRTTLIRAAALYVPIAGAVLARISRPSHKRLFAATLVAFAWTLPSLLLLQVLNLQFDWWSFHVTGGTFRDMPVDLYLGWSVLWSILPVVLFRRLAVPLVATIFFCVDLALMPLCRPVVTLGSRWLVGETVAIVIVLLPALFFARWTLDDRRLVARATMQVFTSGLFLLFFLPEVVFAMRGYGWSSLFRTSIWLRNLLVQAVVILAVPALSAVQEFVVRGRGTPIPYDPPQRLVTSGMYRYIANPMQLSCALVMAAWGMLFNNPWIMTASAGTIAYAVGLAGWDERADLEERFGESWLRFRREVRDWYPRWRPYVDEQIPRPRLYIAETCGICSELRHWLEQREPHGLEFVAAEAHPTRSLTRITYDPMDESGDEQGIRAFARALEHINLAWALVGALMRLPGASRLLQMVADASGLGPKTLGPRACDI